MTQAILDLYPDVVSQFGLCGCFLATIASALALACVACSILSLFSHPSYR